MKRISFSIVCIFLISTAFAETNVSDVNIQFIQAANDGDLPAVQTFLSQGADVNAMDDNGKTALIAAAFKNHTEVVNFLLENGADVNAKNNSGKTALIVAAFKGYTDVVKLLLEKGADTNVKANNGDTALTVAEKNGHIEIVHLLEKAETKKFENIVKRIEEKSLSASISNSISFVQDNNNIILKYSVAQMADLKPNEWPALFIFFSSKDGAVLNERIIREMERYSHYSLAPKLSKSYSRHLCFAYVEEMAGYGFYLYDKELKKIRQGTELKILFMDSEKPLVSVKSQKNTFLLQVNLKETLRSLGDTVKVSASLVAFEEKINTYFFQCLARL